MVGKVNNLRLNFKFKHNVYKAKLQIFHELSFKLFLNTQARRLKFFKNKIRGHKKTIIYNEKYRIWLDWWNNIFILSMHICHKGFSSMPTVFSIAFTLYGCLFPVTRICNYAIYWNSHLFKCQTKPTPTKILSKKLWLHTPVVSSAFRVSRLLGDLHSKRA